MAMTEREWLACSDPKTMLKSLLGGKASNRKLRLFAVACCNRVRPALADPLCGKLIDLAERFADGNTTEAKLDDVRGKVAGRYYGPWHGSGHEWERIDDIGFKAGIAAAFYAAAGGQSEAFQETVPEALHHAIETVWHINSAVKLKGTTSEEESQVALLRDILGLLSFRPVIINPAWRTSNVNALAQSIYNDRAFDRLPILADALEDAGCDNADILNHCRQPGEHVRGCWVVDIILGKK
jgi:hypothetical protein